MKKIISAISVFVLSMSINVQSFDFSNFTGWSPNIRNAFTVPVPCSGVTALGNLNVNSAVANRIIQNTVNQRYDIDRVRGAHENRVWNDLSNLYTSNFNFECNFNILETESGKDFFISALTSANNNINYSVPMVTCLAMNNHDVLAFEVYTPLPSDNGDLRIKPYILDNGVVVQVADFISLQYGVSYFPRISVNDNGTASFQVFTNEERTTLLDEFCFTLPETVRNLRFLQIGTNLGAGLNRIISGWVDNINIYQNDVCCNISIEGQNVVCAQNESVVTVNTSGSSLDIEVSPSHVVVAINGNQVIVQDWGTFSTIPKIVTITASSICKCEKLETVREIHVYPELDASFDIFNAGSTGTNLNNFTCQSVLNLNGLQHTWSVWTSDGNGNLINQIRPNDNTSGATYY